MKGSGDIAACQDRRSANEDVRRPIRVVLAEGSYLIREVLVTTLVLAPEVELVAVCTNNSELETAVATWRPDVVVTDIRMGPSGAGEGIRFAARLRDASPDVGVVALSHDAEPAYALALLDGGTGRRAYLLKERIRNRADLIGSITAVACGESVIDPMIVDALITARARGEHSRLARLAAPERRVLAEIASGKSDGAIAEALVLPKRTAKERVSSICCKLHLPLTEDVSRRVRATLTFLTEEDDARS